MHPVPDLLPAPARGSGRPHGADGDGRPGPPPLRSAHIDQIQPVPFGVRLETRREQLLVIPRGELDVHTAERLRAAMQEQFAGGCDHVVADLRELTFIDSSGIRALWQTHARAEQDGVRLSVIPGDGDVRRALTLTGVLDLMHLLD
jgi:anti-anti-sigma factor